MSKLNKKNFLEIGPGVGQGLSERGESEYLKDPEVLYIGMDYDPNTALAESKKRALKNEKKNVEFITGDGRQLPFKNESIHTVYLGNVVGDDATVPKLSTLLRILQEAHRVLDANGQLIITEYYTPLQRDRTIECLRDVGFTRIDTIDTTTPRWEDIWRMYNKYQPAEVARGVRDHKFDNNDDKPHMIFAAK